MAGSGLLTPWAVIAWIQLVLMVGYTVLFWFAARDYRRAGAYLDMFAGPVSAAPGR
jgi:ABC-type multidrug transport system permease subunit